MLEKPAPLPGVSRSPEAIATVSEPYRPVDDSNASFTGQVQWKTTGQTAWLHVTFVSSAWRDAV